MIEEITYKEKQYPVRIGYKALKRFKLKLGMSFQQAMEKGGDEGAMDYYEPLLQFSLEAGHEALDLKSPFKDEDIEDVLDECLIEFLKLLPKFFPEGLGEEMALKQGNRQKRRQEKKKAI